MTLVRFAPSPTGHLHVGNLRTALVNFLFAKAQGGKFMLRIDDTDDERSTKEFEESIREDLTWMGMAYDSEARQSARLERYEEVLQQLLAAGRAYPCFETQEELNLKRKAQLAAGKPPLYDRGALALSEDELNAKLKAGQKPYYRFKLNDSVVKWDDLVRGEVSVPMSSLSDPVIMRADGRVIYTLASVVDDLDYKITHILRGEDHTTNSAAQIQLFEALGGKAPQMGHFALLAGAEGEGLSKRFDSLAIRQLREEGIEAMALASLLARIGTSEAISAETSMDALIGSFAIERFSRATPKVDVSELWQLNARILGLLNYDVVAERLKKIGADGGELFWRTVQGNLTKLQDAKVFYDMIYAPITPMIEDKDFLEKAVVHFPEGEPHGETWSAWTEDLSKATGLKGKAVFQPLRLALTGEQSGPELKMLLPLMGRKTILKRLSGEKA